MSSRNGGREEKEERKRDRVRKKKVDEDDSASNSEEEELDDRHRKGRSHSSGHEPEKHKVKKRHREEQEESDESEDEESSDSEDSKDRERDKEKRRKERRKRRREEKEERRKRRKERQREKDEKKKRRSKDEDEPDEERRKKKKLLKEAKKFLEKQAKRSTMVPVGKNVQVEPISETDYFNKNQELATWLQEERGVFFSALSAEESREVFKSFVELWNEGQLSEKYYKGIDKAPRTGHNWAIKRGADTVVDPLDDEARRAAKQLEDERQKKRFRKEQEGVLEEMLPKATGREALLEKKAARREANKAREWSPEPMGERDMMGGGDDFQARLAREKAWRGKKATAKASAVMEKQAVFQEQENAKMDQFKALVNMAGGRITIPKRNDPPPL